MTSDDFKDIDRAAIMYHRITEAFKFAFAHRTQMGDAAFVNLTQVCKYLFSFAIIFFKYINLTLFITFLKQLQ